MSTDIKLFQTRFRFLKEAICATWKVVLAVTLLTFVSACGGGGKQGESSSNTTGAATVGFESSSSQTLENSSSQVELLLSNVTNESVEVEYSISGNAEINRDFELSQMSATIPAGALSASVPLQLINDERFELEENIEFTITSAVGADVGEQDKHILTILNDDIKTEEDLLFGLAEGDAQIDKMCAELATENIDVVIRDVFCGAQKPQINNLVQLMDELGLGIGNPNANNRGDASGGQNNPSFAVTAHSSSLVGRFTNAINPRVLRFTATNNRNNVDQKSIATGFQRGETFVEVLARDDNTNTFHAFLIVFQKACSIDRSCTNADLLTEEIEKDWVGVTVYRGTDLENTVIDCNQCHQPGGLDTAFQPLMQELRDPWTHFMRDNRQGGQTLIDDFEAAHDQTTEQNYAGIPVDMVRFSDPEDLEDFFRGNTGVNQGVFDSDAIETEVSDGNNAQPEDNTIPGVSATWQNLYERTVAGEIIPVPYHDVKVTDSQKLQTLTQMYRLFATGQSSEMPDITDAFVTGEALRDTPHMVQAGLDGAGIVTHACTQCHNSNLNPNISRARFNADLSLMSADELRIAQQRINLTEDNLLVMPPSRFKSLTDAEKALATDYLQTLIDQKENN